MASSGALGADVPGTTDSGAVYVFVRSGTTWSQQAKLTASDASTNASMGRSVAIEADTIVVGAQGDSAAGFGSGAAYIFVRSGTTWSEQAKLTASDAAANAQFGSSVDISGDTVATGAEGDDHAGTNTGSAYVFVRSGTTWSEQAKLTASDAAAGDQFGREAVSVDGDTVVVGARADDDAGAASGSAYIFTRSGTTWSQEAKLTASDAAFVDTFGWSVAVEGNSAVIGAPNDDNKGSAYYFIRSGTTWTEQFKLLASDGGGGDTFGRAVAIDEGVAVVGAAQNSVVGTRSGSAYVFEVATNEAPMANAAGPYSGSEGSAIALSDATASDPDDDDLTFGWGANSSLCTFSDPNALNPALTCYDNGNYTATLTVSDSVNDPVISDTTVTVANVAPTVDTITVPLEPINIEFQSSKSVSVNFSDPAEVNDEPYICDFDLDYDGVTFNVDATESGVTGTSCGTTLNYNEAGVYNVKVTVTDKDLETGIRELAELVVVYDPSAGFVTGGGWIDSEAGWCHLDDFCAEAEGKANFGFISKYKNGRSVPEGNTEFNFRNGGLNFHSDSYNWLVINQGGTNAQYKGSGTINGDLAPSDELFKFIIWAKDLDPGGDDTFRIKIWYEDSGEVVVYDNGFDQPISSGNIKIHK